MSEFIVDPEDWPIEEIIKDQAYFDAAMRYTEEQGYSDLADAVHGLKARLKLSKVTNDVLIRRGAELERHNETLLNTIADDNKLLAKKDRVIELLRAVARKADEYASYDVVGGRGYTERLVDRHNLRNCLQDAIDGGALDGEPNTLDK